jgi:hypothetical protein
VGGVKWGGWGEVGGVGVGATWWGGGSVDGTLYVEGGELGVVGMMAGPSSVKDGYIVIEHFGNTYKYR